MDLNILQGRSELFTIGPLETEAGGMENLANKKVLFVAKADELDTDAAAILIYGLVVDGSGVATTANGITFGRYVNGVLQDATATSGYLTLEIDDDDTRTLAAGTYPYELALVDGTRPYTLRSGNLIVAETLIDDPEALVP